MEKYLVVTTLDYNDGNYVTGTFEVNKEELDFIVPYFKKVMEVQNEDMTAINNGTLNWNDRRRLNDILVAISKEENDLSAIQFTYDKLYWGPRKEVYEYTKHYILKYFPNNPEDSYDKQDYHTLVSFKIYALESVIYEGKQVDQETDKTGRRVFNYIWLDSGKKEEKPQLTDGELTSLFNDNRETVKNPKEFMNLLETLGHTGRYDKGLVARIVLKK